MRAKYVLAMLTASSAAASQANAATIVENYGFAVDHAVGSREIDIAGVHQFDYTYSQNSKFKTESQTIDSFAPHAFISGAGYSTAGLPDASEIINGKTATVAGYKEMGSSGLKQLSPAEDSYYHLQFTANGETYRGTAYVDAQSTLQSITYAQVAGVPEPAVWAELLLGFGAAGTAMRASRRRRQVAAIA